jgi:uncharacterized HhH-GPD family protein
MPPSRSSPDAGTLAHVDTVDKLSTSKGLLPFSGDPEADELLEVDPLALVIGMVLDQQVPLEKAFRGPLDLRERLGEDLDAAHIAAMDPDELVAAFAERPALHRFPASMAKRVQETCAVIADQYGGDAASIWTGAADGTDLYERVRALPGFGEQKARIFVALLAKRLGVKPDGWEKAAGRFGEPGTFQSVADIDGPESLARVRAYKKQMKAAHAAEQSR